PARSRRVAAAVDQTRLGFPQPHLGLCRVIDPRATQADFAPPTQRPAEGCGDDRPGTVAEGQVGALKLAYDLVELVPVSVLRLEQDQHEVCAGGQIAGLIPDAQNVTVARRLLQAIRV